MPLVSILDFKSSAGRVRHVLGGFDSLALPPLPFSSLEIDSGPLQGLTIQCRKHS